MLHAEGKKIEKARTVDGLYFVNETFVAFCFLECYNWVDKN